jgi:hypothetical protein
MSLTIHLITHNNEKELTETLLSVQNLDAKIIVHDIKSLDNTVEIAHFYGAEVKSHAIHDTSVILNESVENSTTDFQLYLRPGDVLASPILREGIFTVIQDNFILKEIRYWNKKHNYKFVNPINEYLDTDIGNNSQCIIYSKNNIDLDYKLNIIQEWKTQRPFEKQPHYYEAMTLLQMGKYDDFLRISRHYMFLDQRNCVSTVMNRYYFAMISLLHKKEVKSVMQNINLCLCVKPLMAEFWCLIGDVYYYLLNNFDKASTFYHNAITLGKRRLTNDLYPMDITKYEEYPQMMINSCRELSISILR